MSQFGDYARYYDLIYADKDTAAEVDHVEMRLRQQGVSPGRLLEIGGGTGRHAAQFARRGWSVTTVEPSESMRALAVERAKTTDPAHPAFEVVAGDGRSVRMNQTYDAVISLFHVASYQITDEDLTRFLQTAAEHLRPGGVFIFDFWYGPAVIHDPPQIRVKRVEDDAIALTRIAEPVWMPMEDRVDVRYDIAIHSKSDATVTRLEELHSLRYFFLPSLRRDVGRANFSVSKVEGWMSEDSPTIDTFGVMMVCEKRS